MNGTVKRRFCECFVKTADIINESNGANRQNYFFSHWLH